MVPFLLENADANKFRDEEEKLWNDQLHQVQLFFERTDSRLVYEGNKLPQAASRRLRTQSQKQAQFTHAQLA